MLPNSFCNKTIGILMLLFCSFQLANAQETTERTSKVEPVLISDDFQISADLDHPAWNKASSVFIKHQIQPNDNAAAHVDTEVKVLYSQQNLYLGFICEDPSPSDIRANISDRDNSFQDDFVGAFIDPFNNNQHAYELFVNPLGIQMDGMRTGDNEDMNVDLLWYSDGKITDTGYRTVLKIPFKSLNFPQRDVQDWSIQFIRNYPRSNRYQFTWSDVDLSNSCLMCQNGELTGMQGVESSNTVELLPYGMSYQSSSINNVDNPTSGLDHEPVQARFGGSISYSPSSTTSLNAVVNPDFSQVETDASQIGVNQTFALFYPEKRPFFKRESDLFTTSETLFYSRTINRPLAAGKFTKQGDRYSFAFLTAYDRDTPFVVPGLYGSDQLPSDIDAYNNILRGKYNIGSESYIGGLLTTRNQQEGWNYVGSLDWSLSLAEHYYFSGQVGYSDTKELNDPNLFTDPRTFGQSEYDATFNGEQFSGTLLNADFSRQAKHYNFGFSYTSYSPTFITQTGLIDQTDRRVFEANQSVSYYPDKDWLSNGSLSATAFWRYDFSGAFQERFIFLNWYNSLSGQTNVTINYLPLNDESFRGEFFTNMQRVFFNISTNPWDALSFGGNIDVGRYVYRAQNPELGHGYNAGAFATIKPTSRLEINLNYNYSTLSSLDDTENFYSGSIVRMTSRYNFSKKLFARLITEYNSFNDQIQLYPLVYYKLNPFSKFYIGMTDYMREYDQPGPNGFNGYKETNRQFFVKFQYLIRS